MTKKMKERNNERASYTQPCNPAGPFCPTSSKAEATCAGIATNLLPEE